MLQKALLLMDVVILVYYLFLELSMYLGSRSADEEPASPGGIVQGREAQLITLDASSKTIQKGRIGFTQLFFWIRCTSPVNAGSKII